MRHRDTYTISINIDGETRVEVEHNQLSLRRLNRIYARLLMKRVRTKAQACRILGITDKTLNRLLREEIDS